MIAVAVSLSVAAIMVAFLVCMTVGIVCQYLKDAQQDHYDFLDEQKEKKDIIVIYDALEQRLKEFDEYKKRLDTLTLKAGFKLWTTYAPFAKVKVGYVKTTPLKSGVTVMRAVVGQVSPVTVTK